MRKTKERALHDLAAVVIAALRISRALTPEQAAERAWHPGGPSKAELAKQIERGRLAAAERSA